MRPSSGLRCDCGASLARNLGSLLVCAAMGRLPQTDDEGGYSLLRRHADAEGEIRTPEGLATHQISSLAR